MNDRFLLEEQVQELQRRLNRIQDLITKGPPAGEGIEKSLLDRVHVRFENRVLDYDRGLRELRTRLRDPGIDVADCWNRLRSLRGPCQALMSEALAVLQGALARTACVDDGFCGAADLLISEISRLAGHDWTRFTIPDEGELYSAVADVIRIRFPSAGVWDLPVAAHECGHFVSRQLLVDDRYGNRHHAFQEFLLASGAEQGSALWNHLHEFFADIFATYTVGPAYAFSALRLRFDSSDPEAEFHTHPSGLKRAYNILRVLDWMDRQLSYRPLTGIIADLRQTWPPLSADRSAKLDRYVDDILGTFEKAFPLVRYQGWPRAIQLSDEIARELPVTPNLSIRDILNAAWLQRVREPESREKIEKSVDTWLRVSVPGIPMQKGAGHA